MKRFALFTLLTLTNFVNLSIAANNSVIVKDINNLQNAFKAILLTIDMALFNKTIPFIMGNGAEQAYVSAIYQIQNDISSMSTTIQNLNTSNLSASVLNSLNSTISNITTYMAYVTPYTGKESNAIIQNNLPPLINSLSSALNQLQTDLAATTPPVVTPPNNTNPPVVTPPNNSNPPVVTPTNTTIPAYLPAMISAIQMNYPTINQITKSTNQVMNHATDFSGFVDSGLNSNGFFQNILNASNPPTLSQANAIISGATVTSSYNRNYSNNIDFMIWNLQQLANAMKNNQTSYYANTSAQIASMQNIGTAATAMANALISYKASAGIKTTIPS